MGHHFNSVRIKLNKFVTLHRKQQKKDKIQKELYFLSGWLTVSQIFSTH